MGDLFGKTTESLAASLDFRLRRHNVTSSNIANAETPGYKAKKVEFEKSLKRAINLEGKGQLTTSHSDHFPVGQGKISNVKANVYDNPNVNVSNDKNTVDLEKEMATMGENTILYKTALRLISKKLGSLKYASQNGGL